MKQALALRPLARAHEDDAFLQELVGTVVEQARTRIEDAAGPVRAVVLGGSLARSEGTVWRGSGGPRVLSDVDLVFVTANEGARERARVIAPYVARGLIRRLRERGLDGAVDLAVYAPGDLGGLSHRPGTLELRRNGRVLAGDADTMARLPALEEKDLPREEALVLLENRGIELLLAWPGNGHEGGVSRHLAALYAGSKVWLDGALAYLVAHGQCPATLEARQAAFETLAVEGRSEALGAVLPDSIPSIRFWSAMKLAPDPAAIALRLRVRDAKDVVALARRGWSEGVRAWLGFYRALAMVQPRTVSGLVRGVDAASVPPVAVLAGHAAHRARFRRRLRRWFEVGRSAARAEREGAQSWALRPWPGRASLVLRGTPEHELAACGAVLLAAWSGASGVPDWRRSMKALFPGECPETLEWDRCRSAVVRLWDTMHMSGTRTAWEAETPDTAGARVAPAASGEEA